ncbi:hypothetical protein NMG60_11018845 [Bertholletia excelsa]
MVKDAGAPFLRLQVFFGVVKAVGLGGLILRPDLKRGNFAEDEEDLIIKLHALLGNRWSLIAGRLPGRTDNEVKNYWNSHLRRKLISMGIDPNNHRLNQSLPRSQNPDASGSAASSASKLDPASQLVKKRGDDDQTSDGASSLEDATRALPDLNLELTITLPSSVAMLNNEDRKENKPVVSRELECGPNPTLLLFR